MLLYLRCKTVGVKTTEIQDLFRKFKEMTVLVIGDAMVDSYLYGIAERLSPEAPVPVVDVTTRERRPGGAANVALNLKALGARALLFSVTGNDEEGKHLRKLMYDNDLPAGSLFSAAGRITTVKSRIFIQGRLIARMDEETTDFLPPDLEQALLNAVCRALEQQKVDAVLFVDYDKGVISPGLFRQVRDQAMARGIFTAVDPKKRQFGDYDNVDLFKPNFREFCEGTGELLSINDIKTLQSKAENYRMEKSIRHLLLTLSEQGILMTGDYPPVSLPPHSHEITDVSGAGDTVISLASLCLAAGASPLLTARISNTAAGLVCRKAGVIAADKESLLQEMTRNVSLQPC